MTNKRSHLHHRSVIRAWSLFGHSDSVICHFGAVIFLIWATGVKLFAQDTEIQFLSGHGKDDAVPWQFLCTSGANSGLWTNLPVPSQWDVKGFGTLTYHKDLTNAWNRSEERRVGKECR